MNERRRMAKMTLRAEWRRRRRYPWAVRWRIFLGRRKVRATWQEWWTDLVYLARG
jgi:hypothetical protein